MTVFFKKSKRIKEPMSKVTTETKQDGEDEDFKNIEDEKELYEKRHRELVDRAVTLAREGEIDEASELLNKFFGDYERVRRDVLKILNSEINEADEWVWIEGYKGTELDMSCRGYKYEFNKTFIHQGDVSLCKSGFHLCLDLEDVFEYYPIDNYPKRYFKVRALVLKKDLLKEEKGVWCLRYDSIYSKRARLSIEGQSQKKIVAKEIKFLEELSFDELKEHILKRCSFIDTVEKWEQIKKMGTVDEYVTKETKNDLVKYGMSEILANIFLDNERINKKRTLRDKFVGMVESGVSMDMCIYLLATEKI